jgi:hypothetical protein
MESKAENEKTSVTLAVILWCLAGLAVLGGLLIASNYAKCECGYVYIISQISDLERIMLLLFIVFVCGGLLDLFYLRERPELHLKALILLSLLEPFIAMLIIARFLLYPAHWALTAPYVRPLISAFAAAFVLVMVLLRLWSLRGSKKPNPTLIQRISALRALLTLCIAAYWGIVGIGPWIELTHEVYSEMYPPL